MTQLTVQCATAVRRSSLIVCVAAGLTGCANEPAGRNVSFAPLMMLSGPATAAELPAVAEPADPFHELSHKSLAAKVLASRALETVTGLPIDPARFSEHD